MHLVTCRATVIEEAQVEARCLFMLCCDISPRTFPSFTASCSLVFFLWWTDERGRKTTSFHVILREKWTLSCENSLEDLTSASIHLYFIFWMLSWDVLFVRIRDSTESYLPLIYVLFVYRDVFSGNNNVSNIRDRFIFGILQWRARFHGERTKASDWGQFKRF